MRKKQGEITHFFKGIGISLARLKLITHQRSRFGFIQLFRHPELGKGFVLDGEIQHVEAWVPLYHEPLVHLPAAFVQEVQDVLILGGGTLFAAWEALKYKTVKRVFLFERDPAVIDTVAKHYDHARACLDDPRLILVHKDAYSSLQCLGRKFDLVINDGVDLLAIGSKTAGKPSKIFSAMMDALKPNGVCADVVFRHLFEKKRTRRTIDVFQENTRSALSLVFLPEYHGVLHVLCTWGGEASAINQNLQRPQNREQLT
jgi:spermidine synthase